MAPGCEVYSERRFEQTLPAEYPSLLIATWGGAIKIDELDAFCNDACSCPSKITPLFIKGNAGGQFLVCYRNNDDRKLSKEYLDKIVGPRGWAMRQLWKTERKVYQSHGKFFIHTFYFATATWTNPQYSSYGVWGARFWFGACVVWGLGVHGNRHIVLIATSEGRSFWWCP